jgi:hypothetical protein
VDRRVAVLVVAAACRPNVELEEVPVLGGTAEDRERIRAELAAFADAIGPDRVKLRSVRIVDDLPGGNDEWDIGGSYRADHTVRLVPGDGLTVRVRHELCHALDHAEDLMAKPHPLFDDLAAGLFADPSLADLIPQHYRTAREQREEAHAQFCEVGPMAASALTRPCGPASDRAVEVGQWLRDHVYTAYDEPPPLELDRSTAVTKDGWAESPTVAAGPEPGTVVVGADEGELGEVFDLYTGAWADTPAEPVPNVQEGPPARGLEAWQRAGFADGPAVAEGWLATPFLQVGGPRLFLFDPAYGRWREVVPGCQPMHWDDFFTADGQVWQSFVEEEVLLRWMPLIPE